MPDPTAPATADELAALYLRGRDVACPGCGYNRRDAVSSVCPECNAVLALDVAQKQIVPMTRRVARRLAWLLIAATVLGTFGMLFNVGWALWTTGAVVLRIMPMQFWVGQGLYLVPLILACGFAVKFLLDLRSSENGRQLSARFLVHGISALLIAIVLTNIFQIVLIVI